MNRNTATTNQPVKRTIAKYNSAMITYLNKNYGRVGTDYLYRIVYKGFTPPNTAAVRFIQIPLDKTGNRIIKRAFDIALSLIVIAGVLSWLIPVMTALIKATSRGPVFFLQKRNKKDGVVFTCIKFRSMQVNAMADILPAAENDTRITPVGRFIRKTFIDELPQFFNVLWGDMSVIGPRPHMLSEGIQFEEAIHYYNYREKVKPGITGLAQIMGLEGAANSIEKMKDRIDVDIFYLRHWTLKLDVVILYRTICKMTGI
ncbi:sugar transferase [Ferruginibacter sp. SUN106]|uniref:sugar transferase n=1 Tax=Ferruginibacter sp. SUN106 TaxID=2978348 RepID=UPI003D35EC9E